MSEKILIDGPISQEIISSLLASLAEKTDAGGHSVFIGQVRGDIIGAKRVIAIEYSAYENMVEAEADKIKKTVLSEFVDVKSVDILHSAGVVKTGEISLFVLVSAGHRHHAIKACAKAVEMIKTSLPIWKKEIFEDNSSVWQGDNLA
jgi:molybdopterin synthase catalytic subunit